MRGTCLQLLALLLLVWHLDACKPRVAIIGGGIGGGFAAYWLSNLTAGEVAVDIYDEGIGGGRAQEITLYDEVVELGASMVYGKNHYMRQLTEQLGLTVKVYGDDNAWLHIYDGKRLVLRLGGSTLRTYATMLTRYGLAPLAYGRFATRMFANFSTVYDLQAAGHAYPTVGALLHAMGLAGLTDRRCNDTLREVLHASWWSRLYGATAFAEQLVAAINRCNYNQRNSQLNALTGAVSYLPAADPDVWAIEEGNGALARALAKAAGALRHYNTTVAAVRQDDGGQYSLELADGGMRGPYDAVIVAAPLATANLSLPPSAAPVPPRKYQTTVTTFVRGALQAAYFSAPTCGSATSQHACLLGPPGSLLAQLHSSYREASERLWQRLQEWMGGTAGGGGAGGRLPLASQVFVTEHSDAPFTAIAVKKVLSKSEALYKVFSSEPLDNATLAAIFGPTHEVLAVKSWAAYPLYSPPEDLPPFELAPGLYYNNAIEVAAAAMEMSAIAGRNSALLAARHLRGRCDAAADSSGDASVAAAAAAA